MKHNTYKMGFYGRNKFAKGGKGLLRQAIEERRSIIKNVKDTHLKTIESLGINIFKQVELYTKYRPVFPSEDQDNDLDKRPRPEVFVAVAK